MCPRGCCTTYREHLTSLRLAVTSPEMVTLRREDKDMDAFKRLTESGVTPAKIDGAAALERQAETPFEVENASILTSAPERRKLAAALQESEAHKPSTAPLEA